MIIMNCFLLLAIILVAIRIYKRFLNPITLFYGFVALYFSLKPIFNISSLFSDVQFENSFGFPLLYFNKMHFEIGAFLVGGLLSISIVSLVKKPKKLSVSSWLTSERSIFILNTVILTCTVTAIVSIFFRYFSGGYSSYFLMSRKEFFETGSSNILVLFQHYYFAFISVVLISFLKFSKQVKSRRYMKANYCLILLYLLICLLTGNRLILISSVITFLYVRGLFEDNKRLLKPHYSVLIVVLVLLLSFFGSIRGDLGDVLFGYNELDNVISDAQVNNAKMYPLEFDTMYDGHRVAYNVGVERIESNPVVAAIPSSLLSVFGKDKTTISRQTSSQNSYSSGFAVFVYPFVAEGVFYEIPVFTSFIVGFFFTSVIYLLSCIRGFLGVLFIFPTVSNAVYYARNELSTSVTTLIYSTVLVLIVYIFTVTLKRYKS